MFLFEAMATIIAFLLLWT